MKQATHSFSAGVLSLVLLSFGEARPARAYDADLGSDGSDGALNVTTDTVLPLPDDGIFHFTTITVAAGATLSFSYAQDFHPGVVLLATGDVVVDGTIDVSGEDATSTEPGRAAAGGTHGMLYTGSAARRSARGVLTPSTPTGFSGNNPRPHGGSGGVSANNDCSDGNGGGGGGSLVLISNGTVRGAGTITVLGGEAFNSGCGNPYADGATDGGDGEMIITSNRFEGSGLTVLADQTHVHSFELVSTASGPAGSEHYDVDVQPWRPLPTITITHIDGTPVTPTTFHVLPAGTTAPVIVRVRVLGCAGASGLRAYVQAYNGGSNVSTGGTYYTQITAPTGDDAVDVAIDSVHSGRTYTLYPGVGCSY